MTRDIREFLRHPSANRPSKVTNEAARHRQPWRGSTVQSLLFDVETWTPDQARRWALDHRYRANKIHVTKANVRIRQHGPRRGKPKRIIQFGHGIRAIVEST